MHDVDPLLALSHIFYVCVYVCVRAIADKLGKLVSYLKVVMRKLPSKFNNLKGSTSGLESWPRFGGWINFLGFSLSCFVGCVCFINYVTKGTHSLNLR